MKERIKKMEREIDGDGGERWKIERGWTVDGN